MNCVVCDKSPDDEGFQFYGGNKLYGPAYWSDEGVLCSPQCALKHFQIRLANGTYPAKPSPYPGVAGR